MDSKLKHLEFIQGVIKRMAGNSFLLRGWSVTLIVAALAFARSSNNTDYVIIAFALIIIFWALDGYYLSQERQFRALYNGVRLKDDSQIDFSMNTKKVAGGRNSWLYSLFSKIFLLFYGGIFLLVLALTILSQFSIQIIINKI